MFFFSKPDGSFRRQTSTVHPSFSDFARISDWGFRRPWPLTMTVPDAQNCVMTAMTMPNAPPIHTGRSPRDARRCLTAANRAARQLEVIQNCCRLTILHSLALLPLVPVAPQTGGRIRTSVAAKRRDRIESSCTDRRTDSSSALAIGPSVRRRTCPRSSSPAGPTVLQFGDEARPAGDSVAVSRGWRFSQHLPHAGRSAERRMPVSLGVRPSNA
jgi:hypothetical protein